MSTLFLAEFGVNMLQVLLLDQALDPFPQLFAFGMANAPVAPRAAGAFIIVAYVAAAPASASACWAGAVFTTQRAG